MAALPETAGRIHKTTFIVSTAVLCGVALLTAIARLYIRAVVQRQLGLDDAFIIFGLACLLAAMVIIMENINATYVGEAFIVNLPGFVPPPDVIQILFDSRKASASSGILTWVAISSVKFSFLFLFRKLISRVQSLVQYYWWFVVWFNLVSLGLGCASFIVGCPYFNDLRMLQCTEGIYQRKLLNYAIASMCLDVIGDVLILVIPIHLIWKIRIQWTQKIALAGSLCLTAVLIVLTIIRVSGLMADTGTVDAVWETYWLTISAELGLILTSVTAFRTLFIARSNSRSNRRPSNGSQSGWFARHFGFLLTNGSRSRSHSHSTPVKNDSSAARSGLSMARGDHFGRIEDPIELPQAPRPARIGVRTFIQGRSANGSRASWILPASDAIREEDEADQEPLSTVQPEGRIRVLHAIDSRSERVSDESREMNMRYV